MMAVYQLGQAIEISDTFFLEGVATDPTAVVYTISDPEGTITTYSWPGAPEIDHPDTGEFVLSLGAPTVPGLWQYDVDATGAVVASRAGNFTIIPNVSAPFDADYALVGPCSPWADAQDVWNCCGQPTTLIGEGTFAEECPIDMTQYAYEASQVLYELSGRQYAGVCEKTVRPCGNRYCGFQVLSRGHIVDYGYQLGWYGAYWWWPGWTYGCGCTPYDRILLSGYPVREITEVKIDGAVVAPDEYRLDERRWLTRLADTDGNVQLWPACQRLDMADTEPGTFSVTYRYGQDPPITGVHAAAQLGCELYRACTGGDCTLPSGATRVTRQGVTIERGGFTQWGYKNNTWMTGLSLVDTFLNSYNRQGNLRRPSIYSPSGPKYARTVGQ